MKIREKSMVTATLVSLPHTSHNGILSVEGRMSGTSRET